MTVYSYNFTLDELAHLDRLCDAVRGHTSHFDWTMDDCIRWVFQNQSINFGLGTWPINPQGHTSFARGGSIEPGLVSIQIGDGPKHDILTADDVAPIVFKAIADVFADEPAQVTDGDQPESPADAETTEPPKRKRSK